MQLAHKTCVKEKCTVSDLGVVNLLLKDVKIEFFKEYTLSVFVEDKNSLIVLGENYPEAELSEEMLRVAIETLNNQNVRTKTARISSIISTAIRKGTSFLLNISFCSRTLITTMVLLNDKMTPTNKATFVLKPKSKVVS